jgi:intracellular sulfur oxidation DsrE/DsrF family protein
MLSKILIAAAVALPLLGAGNASADPRAVVAPDRVVYHVNDTDAQASNALRNIGNHLQVNPQARIVVVTHARGVDFLLNDARDRNGNPFNIQVEQLKARGVRFDVCEITVSNRNLQRGQFIPEATFVPSGVAEVTRLQQREGFAYLRP